MEDCITAIKMVIVGPPGSLKVVLQLCALCDHMDCSLSGSSTHGILRQYWVVYFLSGDLYKHQS